MTRINRKGLISNFAKTLRSKIYATKKYVDNTREMQFDNLFNVGLKFVMSSIS